MTFKAAIKKLPKCIGGLDLVGQHKTVADLRFLVQHEIDLFNEGQETDIQGRKDLLECGKFLFETAPNRPISGAELAKRLRAT